MVDSIPSGITAKDGWYNKVVMTTLNRITFLLSIKVAMSYWTQRMNYCERVTKCQGLSIFLVSLAVSCTISSSQIIAVYGQIIFSVQGN